MDIYEPAEDSYLLKKIIEKEAFGRVLDIGTGSGIQALSLIKKLGVKEITAVDINPKAVETLQKKVEDEGIKKFTIKKSDLFENVECQFETIIFNAPYLPQDYIAGKAIEDPALYGGKEGWEIIERFFKDVGNHLAKGGKIFLLFSSHTNKEKVEELIERAMFEFEELAQEKQPMFETLYVYGVKSSSIRDSLQSHGVKNIRYFDKGRRGLIFKGEWDKNAFTKKMLAPNDEVTVAIKVKNSESQAMGKIKNEIYWLRKSNKEGIGPELYFHGRDSEYVVREFVEGEFLPDYLEKASDTDKLIVLKDVLRQCRILDTLQVSKEEFIRPLKNVMVDGKGKVVLLDFERCHNDLSPSNVTQFVSFLANQGYVDKEKAIALSKEYKEKQSEENFSKILALF